MTYTPDRHAKQVCRYFNNSMLKSDTIPFEANFFGIPSSASIKLKTKKKKMFKILNDQACSGVIFPFRRVRVMHL